MSSTSPSNILGLETLTEPVPRITRALTLLEAMTEPIPVLAAALIRFAKIPANLTPFSAAGPMIAVCTRLSPRSDLMISSVS